VSVPCLFAMSQAIGGERFQETLSAILVSPAARIPLFFGRSLPVVLNGALVSAFALVVGSLILGVHLPASSFAPLALVVLIAAFSCTGLGLINAALSLRIRENAVLSNVIFGFLLIFTGANVPLDDLPSWMSTAAQGLPFTHAIAAARKLANGTKLGDLSLETDNILSERVSAEAAEPLGALVLPVLPYGLTPSFAAYPGSPTLGLETFLGVLRDLLHSLYGQGFRRFLVVNGHGGNLPGGALVREWTASHPEAQAIFHSWWSSDRVQAAAREVDPLP